jgi:hypothetical protein
MLVNVGRVAEGVEQLRQANDMLALYVYTPLSLADGLLAAGKSEEARTYFNAAISLAPDSAFAARVAMYEATLTGDAKALLDPKLPMSAELRAAFLQGFRAVASRDARAKAAAVRALLALPEDQQTDAVAKLLADLGAGRAAFLLARRLATQNFPGPSLFWYPSMRATLSDPEFPALAAQLGLMNYWKKSHTKPDVCTTNAPPTFCAAI